MELCSDSLWNTSVSWDTDSPRLSSCLESLLEVGFPFFTALIFVCCSIPPTGGRWFSLAPPAPTLVHRHLLFSTARSPGCSSRRARRGCSHPCSLPQCSPPYWPLPCHPPHQGAQHQHNLRAGSCGAGLLLQRLLLHNRGILKKILGI